MAPCSFAICLLLAGIAGTGGMVSAQGVQWTVSVPTPTDDGTSSVAFVDQDFIVIQEGPAYGRGQHLQLFAVSTQQQRWTLPTGCPFQVATPTDPSSTTVVGPQSVYHVRRTGLQQLTYLCWSPGQPNGHAVTVSTATGNITAKVNVHSRALSEPASLYAVASAAAGAYCVVASSDALCVSGHGKVWHLGLGSNYFSPPWINEYNGTLAVQHTEAATVQLYNLWKGTLDATLTLAEGASPGIVAGARYLTFLNTQQTPCTAVTLDMHIGTLSGIVTLPGSMSQVDTGQGASSVALMVGDGSHPELILTLPSQPFGSLLGWKVPATTPTAVTAKQLFNTPLVMGSESASTISWAVSPGYVIVVLSEGFETSTSTQTTNILRVGDGSLVTSFSTGGAPVSLTSVSERDGYVAATGSYTTNTDTFTSGSGVTVLNSTTGMPLWTRANAEIIGPDMMPLDTKAGCVMVAPSQGYTGTEWGLVQCIAL